MNFWDLPHPSASPALIEEASGRRWSYGDLKQAVASFSAKLGKRKQKQLGFIMCANTPECVTAYIGSLQSKAVPALFSADLSDELLSSLVAIYRPDWVFAASTSKRPADYTIIGTTGNYRLWGSHHLEEREISPNLALLLLPPVRLARRS